MRNIVIGTAGHIDHGKSALVEALTGTHPDRLEEEKRRGITLDIGFAFLQMQDISIGFVDVPGHERFVRNMLAGASGFDLVLLVIAADESIKPQTREHFEICKLLRIPRGLVVLTKSDLVEPEMLGLVRLEIEDFVRSSFLEGSPIIPVSAKTGAGLQELQRELHRMALETPLRSSSRYLRLPIDRAFAMKGFGTIVTGTLIEGQVKPDDEIDLLPLGRRLRVRRVHSGGKTVAAASAGQRTALNLAGIEHHEVCRGMVLAAPGRFETTSRLDVRIQLLGSAKKLKNRARVHFHHGSAECIAEVHLLGTREIPAGGKALAQLRLTDPMLALPGDRFVLRQFSPVVTIGGGVVLHISQGRRLHAAQTASFLEVQERALDGDFAARAEAIGQIVQQTPSGCSPAELVKRTGWAEVELATMLEHLAAERKVRIVSQQPLVAVSAMTVATATERLCKEVETFHAANPLLPGTSKEDLRTRCAPGLRTEIFRAALEDAVSAGKLSVVGDLVSRASRAIDLLPSEARAKEQIERDFARAGLSSPGVDTIFATLPVQPAQAQKLFQLLVRERVLLKIGNDIVLHRDAVAALRQRLAEYKQARGDRLAVSDFKELTGVSRKFAIPLLEYLDRTGVTRRVGDYRVIL